VYRTASEGKRAAGTSGVPGLTRRAGLEAHHTLELAEGAEEGAAAEERRGTAGTRETAALIGRGAGGSEFVLDGLERDEASAAALDAAVDDQLHRCDVVQEDGPAHGKLEVETFRERAAGIEEYASAGEIDGVTGTGVEDAAAPDQLPLQVQL
jgi:hypothetical protein